MTAFVDTSALLAHDDEHHQSAVSAWAVLASEETN